MEQTLETLLRNGALEYGVRLDDQKTAALLKYKEILLEWNKKFNLTAIEEDREIILKHFVDSLSIMPFLKDINKLVDVGTGAGFPGIPIKIAQPRNNFV